LELIVHCGDVSPPPPPQPPMLPQSSTSSLQSSVLLSYGDGAGYVDPAISSDFRDDGSELIDHCDNVSPSPQLSYGDKAGHDGPCAAKSTEFWDERSELIVPCNNVTGTRCNECCAAVATHFGGGGSGLIDHCDEISSPSSLSTAELSYCGHNDLCGDMGEHGNDVITRSTPCGGVSP